METDRSEFRRALVRITGRMPTEKETGEARRRVRELLEVIQDIRDGRNGMRREKMAVPCQRRKTG
ncbi:MAG: hypothetical protein KIT79_15280 [Deltaproteobacteria bacterium]|nr:hypothetical protein [Deltaproteobacteria bacterium]